MASEKNRAIGFTSSISLLNVETTVVSGMPFATYGSLTGIEEQLLDKSALEKVRLQMPLIALAQKAAQHLFDKAEDSTVLDRGRLEANFLTILTHFDPNNSTHLVNCYMVLDELLTENARYLSYDNLVKRQVITWLINGRVSRAFWSQDAVQTLARMGISLKTRGEYDESGELEQSEYDEMINIWKVQPGEHYWSHENSMALPSMYADEIIRFFIWERDEHKAPEPVLSDEVDDDMAKKSESSSGGKRSLSKDKGFGKTTTPSSSRPDTQTQSGAQKVSAISPSGSSETPSEA